jgi:hypothetical protein
MLRLDWRIVLSLFIVSPACAASSGELIGLWRNTNEARFAEIELRQDGSFTSFSRNNAILAVVPLQEQSGSWRLSGTRLTLDGTDSYSKERSRKRLKLVEIANDKLRMSVDGHTDTYRRIYLPACPEPAAGVKHGVGESGSHWHLAVPLPHSRLRVFFSGRTSTYIVRSRPSRSAT